MTFTLALDMDGVIADTMTRLRQSCSRVYDVYPEEPKTWEFSNCWAYVDKDFDEMEIWKDFHDNGCYQQCLLMDGAEEQTWRFHAEEWDIHILTARSTDFDPLIRFGLGEPRELRRQTMAWLDLKGIYYDEIHFDKAKEQYDFDVLVDDHPMFVSKVNAQDQRDAFLFSQRWNQTHQQSMPHVFGWGEVWDAAQNAIMDKKYDKMREAADEL